MLINKAKLSNCWPAEHTKIFPTSIIKLFSKKKFWHSKKFICLFVKKIFIFSLLIQIIWLILENYLKNIEKNISLIEEHISFEDFLRRRSRKSELKSSLRYFSGSWCFSDLNRYRPASLKVYQIKFIRFVCWFCHKFLAYIIFIEN